MDNSEGYETWKRLRDRWHEANQKARTARGEVTRAFMECAQRKGTGPTSQQLDNVEHLESIADGLSMDLDATSRSCLASIRRLLSASASASTVAQHRLCMSRRAAGIEAPLSMSGLPKRLYQRQRTI